MRLMFIILLLFIIFLLFIRGDSISDLDIKLDNIQKVLDEKGIER